MTKLIRKTQQPSDYPSNQIHDAYSTSTTDTYTCNYINGIVESGSNANGSYTKFADGTMICRRTTNLGSVDINKAWGSFYESANAYEAGDFPQPFIEEPEISIMPKSPFFVEKYGDTNNIKWGKIYPACPRNKTENPCIVYCIAIGKWK